MSITLYDIPSTFPEKTFSPNTWRIRFALNFKGLLYKTEWIEMPDIEQLYKELGIAAVSRKADGSPFYTLPVIQDPATGANIADSLLIAEYLEKTYPGPLPIFPNNTLSLQAAFTEAFESTIAPVLSFTQPRSFQKLNSSSSIFMRRTREPLIGKRIEDILPTGDRAVVEWNKVQEGWTKLDRWYAKNDRDGLLLLGNTISWADFVVASSLLYMKTAFGEESQEWKDIINWNEGRWREVLEHLRIYSTIVLTQES